MPLHEVIEGRQEQLADEEIIRNITTTPWGSNPTSVVVTAYTVDTEEDVTSTVFPVNSPTVAGDVITLSKMKSLTTNNHYRVEVKFTVGGTIQECYFYVYCLL